MANIKLDQPEKKIPKTTSADDESVDKKVPASFTDYYTSEKANGQRQRRTLKYSLPVLPKEQRPELVINANMVDFQKHRLRHVIEQEKRWARDDLRMRKMVVVKKEREEESGKLIRTYAREDGKKSEEGSYHRHQVEQILKNFKPIDQRTSDAEAGDNSLPSGEYISEANNVGRKDDDEEEDDLLCA